MPMNLLLPVYQILVYYWSPRIGLLRLVFPSLRDNLSKNAGVISWSRLIAGRHWWRLTVSIKLLTKRMWNHAYMTFITLNNNTRWLLRAWHWSPLDDALLPQTLYKATHSNTQTLIVTFKCLANKQGCIFLVAWVCLDYSKDYSNLS